MDTRLGKTLPVVIKWFTEHTNSIGRRLFYFLLASTVCSVFVWKSGCKGQSDRAPPLESSFRVSNALENLNAISMGCVRNLDADWEFAVAAGSWDDFYNRLNMIGISIDDATSLVLRRAARLLSLSAFQESQLLALLNDERQETTNQVLTHFGSYADVLPLVRGKHDVTRDAEFWDAVASIRSSVRSAWNARYRQIVSQQQLDLINGQLRNSTLRIGIVPDVHGKTSIVVGGIGPQQDSRREK